MLERTKLDPKKMVTKEPKECKHVNKDFRGTNAATWRWRCAECGHVESGYKNVGERGKVASDGPVPAEVPHQQGAAADLAGRVMSMMALTLDVVRSMGARVTAQYMDVVYAKCRAAVFGSPLVLLKPALRQIAEWHLRLPVVQCMWNIPLRRRQPQWHRVKVSPWHLRDQTNQSLGMAFTRARLSFRCSRVSLLIASSSLASTERMDFVILR